MPNASQSSVNLPMLDGLRVSLIDSRAASDKSHQTKSVANQINLSNRKEQIIGTPICGKYERNTRHPTLRKKCADSSLRFETDDRTSETPCSEVRVMLMTIIQNHVITRRTYRASRDFAMLYTTAPMTGISDSR